MKSIVLAEEKVERRFRNFGKYGQMHAQIDRTMIRTNWGGEISSKVDRFSSKLQDDDYFR